jgi:hypothetical protein
MSSQELNCAASHYFQNIILMSPNFYIYVSALPRWERGGAVSFLGIHKSDFRYSAEPENSTEANTYYDAHCTIGRGNARI